MKALHFLKPALLALPVAVASPSGAEVPTEGQADYEINCKACHLVDIATVGPSLVSLATLYPEEQRQVFIDWAKTPGKKNPRLIQMPSMAHLPDDVLARIHSYLLKETEGKTERRASALYPNYKSPERKLPYVVRAFLPESSPASIAIIMKGKVSLCWDTEACRLRYAWRGSKTNLNSYFGPAKLGVDPFYKETSSHLFMLEDEQKPMFLGYRMIEGNPEFNYTIGDLEIRELYSNDPKHGTIHRSFKVGGTPGELVLDLSHQGKATISSDQGSLKQDKLTLNPEEAKSFTLTISKK